MTSPIDVMVEVMDGGVTNVIDGGYHPRSSVTHAAQSSTYPVGSTVEYNSKSLGQWIMATVKAFDPDDCTYVLDCKSGVPPERIRWPANMYCSNGSNRLSGLYARKEPEPDSVGLRSIRQPQTKITEVQYHCPKCQEAFSTLEEAGAHCNPVAVNGLGDQGRSAKREPETDSARSDSSTEPQTKFVQQKTKVLYRCPECQEALPTLDEAVTHCAARSRAATELPQTTEFVNSNIYRCPDCQEPHSTLDEAVACCAAKNAAAAQSQQTTGQPGHGGVPSSMLPNYGLPEGTTLVECDRNKNAEPVITRQVDPNTGVARTIVREEDGSERFFGEKTVQSLISSDDSSLQAWVDALTVRQFRGLVHEVGQRLVMYSQNVQGKTQEVSDLQEELNYRALGLSPHVSTKELEAAYKRLAKIMHPDKNGGTEEAKMDFQRMKERYEALRASRKKAGLDRCGYDDEDVEHPFKGGALKDGNSRPTDPDIPGRKEAYDEDEPEEGEGKPQDDGVVSYDPSRRESLNETLWKFLRDLRSLDKKIETLNADIEYLHKESQEAQTTDAEPVQAHSEGA
eukprot:gnl/MRDRNA2_/MRDRNA2_95284_c0_seq1.p1 gnl/MRDRNA2_/MRDRNA2_95284_c0~~gnl/MRDRNA2_/MRDRNA2_95284_c0_seq1.p1  ORF type:complete len:608 (+),score=118.77 gnl/MRDRNA2_/MRDRNA2_95284_c0_seq1:126-1826(+)